MINTQSNVWSFNKDITHLEHMFRQYEKCGQISWKSC